jgi:hypothetical protein
MRHRATARCQLQKYLRMWAGHEDPAFMETQMAPTFEFLDRTLGR